MNHDANFQYNSQFANGRFSRIRWLEGDGTKFLTATYGKQENHLTLWEYANSLGASEKGDDIFKVICQESYKSDLRDLLSVGNKLFAASFGNGDISVVRCDSDEFSSSWMVSHVHDGCASNSLAFSERTIVSCGSNGAIIIANLNDTEIQSYTEGSSPIYSSLFVDQHTLATSHLCGEICLWDLRVPKKDNEYSNPAFQCIATKSGRGITSLTSYPAETNFLAFGTEDGCIGFVDARKGCEVVNVVTVPFPLGPIWELKFRKDNATSLFCVCAKGILLRFDAKDSLSSGYLYNVKSKCNPWLAHSLGSNKTHLSALIDASLSLNTMDVNQSGVLTAGDSQMVFHIPRKHCF